MTVRIQTTAVATFTASGNWANAPTHVRAWIGTNFIGEDDLSSTPALLTSGDNYTIPSGTRYDWTVTPDGAAVNAADAGIAALMNAGADEVMLQFSLHTAALVGTAYGGNEIGAATNPGYSRQSAAFEVVTA